MSKSKKNGIEGLDYIEFYVGNAFQSALFYERFFGFSIIASSNHETGNAETASYVLRQGQIKLVVTAAYGPGHPVAKHIMLHGDSVKAIAFKVSDARRMYQNALNAGAEIEYAPVEKKDQYGTIVESAVKVYGNTIHIFIERRNYNGAFKPGFKAQKTNSHKTKLLFDSIDHVTANIEAGTMDHWVNFYKKAFGFRTLVYFDGDDINTEYAAMSSIVVTSDDGSIKLPLTEPVNRVRRSQIQEFIEHNKGAGIQHLAFHTSNIVQSTRQLRKNGIPFLTIPAGYYKNLMSRISGFSGAIEELLELEIMVDKEPDGFLFQSFTKPILDRPTYFIELIQRKGALSFGKGNVKALFEALMREQENRQPIH